MSTRFNKTYLVVPIIYVGVIFGLLFLQFSGGERLTRTVGPVLLRATRNVTAEGGESGVRDIRLEFNGLSLEFDGDNGLVVESPGALVEVAPTGFVQTESGFLVEFTGGFTLSVEASEDPVPEVQLALEIPESDSQMIDSEMSVADISEISIPFRFFGTATADSPDRSSFVTVRLGDREFYFTAPPDAMIDPANEKIVLSREASMRPIRYVEAVSGNPATVLGWFAEAQNAVTEAQYEQSVNRFVSAAYAGWRGARYNSSAVTWTAADGTPRFSEAALTAYLAEAWRRDDYDRAFAEMRRASDLHGDDLGLLSSVYMGNLIEVSDRIERETNVKRERISEDLDQERSTVFREADLFLFAGTRGGRVLYDNLLAYARSVSLNSVDVTTAVGMLANYSLSVHPTEESRQVTSRFADLAELTILGAIIQTDDGYFLQSAPGQVDVATSIRAGLAIAKIASERNDQTLETAGRNLVVSGLSLADRNGMMPATLLARGDFVEPGPGFIEPEVIYRDVADNRSYPHALPVGAESSPGAWVWTAADVDVVAVSNSEWRFRIEYPRLRTHYIYVSGVPEFDRLELFGQTWRNAPDFEIYSKGRNYDAATQRLMIKYYDDSVVRDIVLFF